MVEDGTFTIGTSAEYEPFEYMEDGEYKGFDLELAELIADDLGLDFEIVNMDFDGLCAAVASGTKMDAAFGAITITPKREKQVDFTDSYYMDDQAIVTMKDNADITGDNYAEALNAEGVKIAVQSGSTAEAFVNENFPEVTAVPFKNATDCFAALQSNQAVALVTNRSVAAQLTASSFDNEQVIKLISTGEEYAIAVSKDQSRPRGRDQRGARQVLRGWNHRCPDGEVQHQVAASHRDGPPSRARTREGLCGEVRCRSRVRWRARHFTAERPA
ncbi:MAG: ABC transporter substrate-binding protein [Collinsella sp.]